MHGNLPRALAALVRIETVQIEGEIWSIPVNPQFEANNCPSGLPFNINNYSRLHEFGFITPITTSKIHNVLVVIFPTVPHN